MLIIKKEYKIQKGTFYPLLLEYDEHLPVLARRRMIGVKTPKDSETIIPFYFSMMNTYRWPKTSETIGKKTFNESQLFYIHFKYLALYYIYHTLQPIINKDNKIQKGTKEMDTHVCLDIPSNKTNTRFIHNG